MDTEKRTLKRRHLLYYLEVFNKENDEVLGHVVDITTRGIKLVSEYPIETKQNFKLRIKLPKQQFLETSFWFEAMSLWNKKDVNPSLSVTGFQALNLGKEASGTITKLINLLGFKD